MPFLVKSETWLGGNRIGCFSAFSLRTAPNRSSSSGSSGCSGPMVWGLVIRLQGERCVYQFRYASFGMCVCVPMWVCVSVCVCLCECVCVYLCECACRREQQHLLQCIQRPLLLLATFLGFGLPLGDKGHRWCLLAPEVGGPWLNCWASRFPVQEVLFASRLHILTGGSGLPPQVGPTQPSGGGTQSKVNCVLGGTSTPLSWFLEPRFPPGAPPTQEL